MVKRSAEGEEGEEVEGVFWNDRRSFDGLSVLAVLDDTFSFAATSKQFVVNFMQVRWMNKVLAHLHLLC